MSATDFRQTVVSMLMIMGDRSEPCSENELGCQGCSAEVHMAWTDAMNALGYKTYDEFFEKEAAHDD